MILIILALTYLYIWVYNLQEEIKYWKHVCVELRSSLITVQLRAKFNTEAIAKVEEELEN